jgi:hypothetical protein
MQTGLDETVSCSIKRTGNRIFNPAPPCPASGGLLARNATRMAENIGGEMAVGETARTRN